MVTTLFFVIMFAYIYLYRIQYISADYNLGDTYRYAVASLVIQLIAYLALGCPYHLQLLSLVEKDYQPVRRPYRIVDYLLLAGLV